MEQQPEHGLGAVQGGKADTLSCSSAASLMQILFMCCSDHLAAAVGSRTRCRRPQVQLIRPVWIDCSYNTMHYNYMPQSQTWGRRLLLTCKRGLLPLPQSVSSSVCSTS